MTRKQLLLIFAAAVCIRLLYDAAVIHFGGSFDNGSDSGKYLKRAMWFLEHGRFVIDANGEVNPDSSRMPIYTFVLAKILQFFGFANLWVVSVVQAFIDAGTVIVIILTAGLVDRNWAWPAAILGCIWSAMIVQASYVLTDTLFLAFFTAGVFACFAAVRRESSRGLLILAGAMFILAVYTRPLLMFFPVLLWPALGYLLASAGGVSRWRAAGLALIPAAMVVIALMPRVATNYNTYGAAVITTQSGNHASNVIELLLQNCDDCNYEERWQSMQDKVREQMSRLTPEQRANPAMYDRIRRQLAMQELLEIPPVSIVKSVFAAAMRTLVQTGLYDVGYQLRRDPVYFSQVQAASTGDRIAAFLESMRAKPFMWFWALAQAAAIAALALQVIGGTAGLFDRDKRPFVVFLMATAAFFLAINGPFASPRYGLPFASSQILLTSAGLALLLSWRRRKKDLVAGA